MQLKRILIILIDREYDETDERGKPKRKEIHNGVVSQCSTIL